jgi:hypothetical protein
MACEKSIWRTTAERFLSTCDNFRLGAADVGDECVGWQMRR